MQRDSYYVQGRTLIYYLRCPMKPYVFNHVYKEGRSAIYAATQVENLLIVESLLEARADPNLVSVVIKTHLVVLKCL